MPHPCHTVPLSAQYRTVPSGTESNIGVDRIMVETDYPHSDSSWPDTQELLARQLHDVPDDEAERITWKNASELYRHPIANG